MLQILDDGRLTDGHGRTVDFKNTIVTMTSNIGSHRILEYRGAFEGREYDQMKQAVLDEMRRHFRPEFLNRVDEVIVFHALSEEHLKEIVDIQLTQLRRLAERHIQIELTDAARTHLVRTGYNPTYGARPLKRAIQKEVETQLARFILKGEVRDGQTVLVDYDAQRAHCSLPPSKKLYQQGKTDCRRTALEREPTRKGASLRAFVTRTGRISVVLQGLEAMLHAQTTTEGNTR